MTAEIFTQFMRNLVVLLLSIAMGRMLFLIGEAVLGVAGGWIFILPAVAVGGLSVVGSVGGLGPLGEPFRRFAANVMAKDQAYRDSLKPKQPWEDV